MSTYPLHTFSHNGYDVTINRNAWVAIEITDTDVTEDAIYVHWTTISGAANNSDLMENSDREAERIIRYWLDEVDKPVEIKAFALSDITITAAFVNGEYGGSATSDSSEAKEYGQDEYNAAVDGVESLLLNMLHEGYDLSDERLQRAVDATLSVIADNLLE